MNTKHTPATPLPWQNGGTLEVVNMLNQPLHRVAQCFAPDDVAYITHAANAYPRLVGEAQVLRCLATSPRFQDMTVAEALAELANNGCGHNAALLRELGEDV